MTASSHPGDTAATGGDTKSSGRALSGGHNRHADAPVTRVLSQSPVMSARDRQLIRYGAPCVAVVAGAICAAALTNTVGNSVATVLIGGGLLAIVIFLLRDMGLAGPGSERTSPEPSHNGSDPHERSTPTGEADPAHPGRQARRSVDVRRPDRMRGQRRRLR
jgi:hypothetical protein